MLMAGERGDPIPAVPVVFGMAILGNIGVYGLVGLIVGGDMALLATGAVRPAMMMALKGILRLRLCLACAKRNPRSE